MSSADSQGQLGHDDPWKSILAKKSLDFCLVSYRSARRSISVALSDITAHRLLRSSANVGTTECLLGTYDRCTEKGFARTGRRRSNGGWLYRSTPNHPIIGNQTTQDGIAIFPYKVGQRKHNEDGALLLNKCERWSRPLRQGLCIHLHLV